MGINPTYPSEKYGYIVPEITACADTNDEIFKVSRFTEKPSVEVAKSLLQENAFWNGDVFAFRIGYIMNIVKKYINSCSFEEIRERYLELPKISFDYEVVEKADSVAVVPFSGEWKDLGTWNSLTNELQNQIIGNAVIGNHCENTHIINELQCPIYVDGLKEVVVAACPEGILICNKNYSQEIKHIVEKFS